MSKKIKLHSLNSLHFLFRIFSFLADKTGGWKLFVKPKLIIGSLILGFGVISCNNNKDKSESKSVVLDNTSDDLIDTTSVMCYETIDTLQVMDEDSIYFIVDKMPKFPGGDTELSKFLIENLIYPELAIQNDAEGRVICQFVVEKDGSIGKIEVLRKVDPLFEKEAVRVIRKMPKWTPGKQNGKNVSVWFTLPINFKLQ